MAQSLKVAVSQSHTLSSTADTVSALEKTVRSAASKKADIILFPEAYLGGYPRTATFGAAVGARTTEGREQFLHYFKDAVDLGDTPEGAGSKWVRRELEQPQDGSVRGDGIREQLEKIAKETGVFIVTGLVERSGGTLYCGVVYVCPRLGFIGKRRKVMPVQLLQYSHFTIRLTNADWQRASYLGSRSTVFTTGHHNYHSRCQAHSCSCHMLGELYAITTTILILAKCKLIPSSNCRC
jgi:predicted amidohydrolase